MSESNRRQRIGIFGGTFDPIHVGHLLIAEFSREQLQLDQVRFIPAATAPHKQDIASTSGKHRMEMVQLAIGGNSSFVADDRELQRGGTSFTVDTLRELRNDLPDSDLFFLMGADSLDELHTWKDPKAICSLAFVAVVARGGRTQPDLSKLAVHLPEEQLADLASHLVAMPQIEISSTNIRSRIASGLTVRYQLHPAVEAFVQASGLYQTKN